MDILNITEKPQIDETIQEYEYHSYKPIAGTNLNNRGEIRLNIGTQDLFTHPAESYLVFDGKLVKAADLQPVRVMSFKSLTPKAHFHSEFYFNISLGSVMTMKKLSTALSIN